MHKPLIALVCLASCLLPACSSTPMLADKDRRVAHDEIVGTWKQQNGNTIDFDDWSNNRYGLRIERPDGTVSERMVARLMDLGDVTYMEVLLNDPAKDQPPVYHYGKVEVSGDTMRHWAISPAWLGQQVDESTLVTSTTEAGRPVAMTTDPDALRAVLRKATNDPSAFQQPETLRRVR